MHFFTGVPAAIVPDNLKSAVTKSNRYEPTLNETFLDFAEHYGTTILPARAYRPRDKALAEGAVKILYQRIYVALRGKTFHSIKELNEAMWIELEAHNNKKLSGRPTSRRQLFEEIEREKLSPLPVERYQIKQLAITTVMLIGHVSLSKDKHYYSVPYQYIRKQVKIMYTSDTVEIYYQYNRIALHKRDYRPFCYTTLKEHLASTHQFITEWTPQRFLDLGASIDESVRLFIFNVLEHKQHPEQAYKSCMGILSFAKKVGNQRLINACRRALDHHIYNYKIIQTILENGLDMLAEEKQEEAPLLPEHYNIRGENYYQ